MQNKYVIETKRVKETDMDFNSFLYVQSDYNLFFLDLCSMLKAGWRFKKCGYVDSHLHVILEKRETWRDKLALTVNALKAIWKNEKF